MNIDIDNLTQVERQELLRKLLDVASHGMIPFGDGKHGVLPLYLEDVPPETFRTVSASPHTHFKPKRLVILEPAVRFVETSTMSEDRANGDTRVRSNTTVTKETFKTVERRLWTVGTMFIGARTQFLNHGSISGDAFGPSNMMDFDGLPCQPGAAIALNVKHAANRPLPFYGVILGEVAEEKMMAGDSRTLTDMLLGYVPGDGK